MIISLASLAFFGLYRRINNSKLPINKNNSSTKTMLLNQTKKMSFDEWRKKPGNLTKEQAKDRNNVAFDLKFPKDESLTGTLEVINGVGNYKGTGASTDIMMMFSKDIKVSQIIPDPDEASGLANYADFVTTDEETKKDFRKVEINGVKGWAAEPKVQDNLIGETSKSPGTVSWYKNGILYTVAGNGNMSVDKLLEIAKLFD